MRAAALVEQVEIVVRKGEGGEQVAWRHIGWEAVQPLAFGLRQKPNRHWLVPLSLAPLVAPVMDHRLGAVCRARSNTKRFRYD